MQLTYTDGGPCGCKRESLGDTISVYKYNRVSPGNIALTRWLAGRVLLTLAEKRLKAKGIRFVRVATENNVQHEMNH